MTGETIESRLYSVTAREILLRRASHLPWGKCHIKKFGWRMLTKTARLTSSPPIPREATSRYCWVTARVASNRQPALRTPPARDHLGSRLVMLTEMEFQTWR